MLRYFFYLSIPIILLSQQNQSCKINNNEKILLSKIYHPVANESSTLDNSKLYCKSKNKTKYREISWSTLPTGILSYDINTKESSQVSTYMFDEGIAYRGEGCTISVGNKDFIQTEKSCGTDGCDLYVWHNKKEVFSTVNIKTNSSRMPAKYTSGFFMLIGAKPSTHRSYEGLATIKVNANSITMTRWINGVKVIALGEEHKNLSSIPNIYFKWKNNDKEIKLVCQANSDNNNNPIITCKSYIDKESSFGVETLFFKSTEITLYENIDLDMDGLNDDLTLTYLPESNKIKIELKASSTSKINSFTLKLDNSSLQDAFCGHNITAHVGSFTNTDNKSKQITELNLQDGLCDSFHVFWNKKTSSLNYWRH